MTEHSSTPGPDGLARNSLQELDALPVPEPSTAVTAAGRRRVALRIGAAGAAVAVLAGAGFAASRLVDRTDRIETTDGTASTMVPPTSVSTSRWNTSSTTWSTTTSTTARATSSSVESTTGSTAPSTESSTTVAAVEETTTVTTIPLTTVSASVATTANTAPATTQSVSTIPATDNIHTIHFRAFIAGPDGSGPGTPLANQEFWMCHLDSSGCTELDRATSDASGYVALNFDTTQEQMLFTDPPGCPGQSTALGPTESYSSPAWVPSRDGPGGVLPAPALDRLLVPGACEPGV